MISDAIIETCRIRESAKRIGVLLPWEPTEAAIVQALADLDRVQQRASARTLTHEQLRATVEVYRDVLRLCRECPALHAKSIHVSRNGGGVPNGYRGDAHTTGVSVMATRPWHDPSRAVPITAGPGGIVVERRRADKRAWGLVLTYRVTVRANRYLLGTLRPTLRGHTPRLSGNMGDGEVDLRWFW